MTSFNAKMGHVGILIDSLNDEKKEAALKCIGLLEKPSDNINAASTYEETYTSLLKITTGFDECLRAQNPSDVIIGGYCGEPSDKEGELHFECAKDACCGKAIAAGAGEETAVYTCQKDDAIVYKPLRMKGYEQYNSPSDWPFQCIEVETVLEAANALISGFSAIMVVAFAYLG